MSKKGILIIYGRVVASEHVVLWIYDRLNMGLYFGFFCVRNDNLQTGDDVMRVNA